MTDKASGPPADNNRKAAILQAAAEVFAAKGYMRANISDIARLAGVTDSMIYQHFKGKEDILFTIPAQFMRDVTQRLEHSLKGIRDATSLLSKAVWQQLYFGETNPQITRILFNCRSQKDFYQSRTHDLIRRYAAILLDILEKGVRDGVFRDGVDMRVVRDIIHGTVDFVLLEHSISIGSDAAPTTDADAIVDFVLPMIQVRPGIAHPPADKASRILLAAERIFSEKGLAKAKLNDVARLAGVGDGTVYEYFKNKEDLLLSICARRLEQHMDQVAEAFEIRSPVRKLRRLIRNHFSLYLTNRSFLKIFILDAQLSAQFYDSPAYGTFQRYYGIIEEVLAEGIAEKVFRPDVQARVFRNMFLGAFSHMAIRWFIAGDDPRSDMMREIDEATDLLSLAVMTDAAIADNMLLQK